MLVEDAQAGKLHATSEAVGHDAMINLLNERGVRYTEWHGWELLDEYEQKLGADFGAVVGGRGPRERVKVVSREAMIRISKGEDLGETDLIGQPGE